MPWFRKSKKFWAGKNEIKGALEDREGQQKTSMGLAQMESEVEDAENELRMDKQKPKRKNWKFQTWNMKEIEDKMEGPTNLERPMSLMNWESPRAKKSKISST